MFSAREKLRKVMKLLARSEFSPKEKMYLNEQFVGRLATARDNAPHVTPVWYTLASGKIYVDIGRDSKKMKNISKNNRVAFVVDDYITRSGIRYARGLLIEGQAEIFESGKYYELGRSLIKERYRSVKGFQIIDRQNRVVVMIHPCKISSWGL